MLQLLLILTLVATPFHSTFAFEESEPPIEIIDPQTGCNLPVSYLYPPQDFPLQISTIQSSENNDRSYLSNQEVPSNAYYIPDGSFEYPYTYTVEATEGEGKDYEKYPDCAYESSISTAKIVTTIVIGAAFIALVAVVLVNTPTSSCCHSRRGSCGH